jgi:hypothetical protein
MSILTIAWITQIVVVAVFLFVERWRARTLIVDSTLVLTYTFVGKLLHVVGFGVSWLYYYLFISDPRVLFTGHIVTSLVLVLLCFIVLPCASAWYTLRGAVFRVVCTNSEFVVRSLFVTRRFLWADIDYLRCLWDNYFVLEDKTGRKTSIEMSMLGFLDFLFFVQEHVPKEIREKYEYAINATRERARQFDIGRYDPYLGP